MNWNWLSFLVGLLAGWLIEWLIDFFFWQRRRGAQQEANAAQLEANAAHLEANAAQLEALQAELDEARAKQRQLEARLADQERAAADCAAELKAKEDALAVATEKLSAAQEKLIAVEPDLEAFSAEQAAAESRTQDLGARLAGAAPAASTAPPVEPQSLTRIEGIGPRISSLLNEAGILNYAQLAKASVDRLREILRGGGSRYRMANPGSWPQQARLAAEEKWGELETLQEGLNAGRASSEPGLAE